MRVNIYFAVGLGGIIGSLARYMVSLLIHSELPYATFSVNIIGCFLLSFIMHHRKIKRTFSTTVLTAVQTGVIGSFTTFSTFTTETIELVNQHIFLALSYILLSIFCGLFGNYLGYQCASKQVDV
ncbi:fluoride efflux transporter CrcB [Virgibacillus soli]|uniref:Fluoride-specific ion channel FluC n=1 Tax=Paracerasibacillus soli TaxID=480284 RepID=A0ABU5CSK7_9BACI|nr:fluoride efflux transporter CrcB [Virgibacillus soli]MDY0408822.1 fluoride efflux transporter CrcB [Virgibacillus soli]